MWAFGIIMHLVLTGRHPFFVKGDTEKTFIERIASGNLEAEVNELSSSASSLFWHLCSRGTSERYTAHQAIKHPWITRNTVDPIPMTQGEEMKILGSESLLRRV